MLQAPLRRLAVLAVALAALAAPSAAVDLEISAFAGPAVPFYEQQFEYDPGPVIIQIPGIGSLDVQQGGTFTLDAKGGLAYGAAAALYVVPFFGFEGRLDTADLDIQTDGGDFQVSADLPPPVPDFSTVISLADGTVDLERVKVYSANIKIRTPGPLRLTVSGGLSYLPELRLNVRQPLGIGATGFSAGNVTIGSVTFIAETDRERDTVSKVGGNIGAGLQIALGSKAALIGEGRYFVFQKSRVTWRAEVDGPLSPLETALVNGIQSRIDPVEFYPTYFHVVAGLALTF